MTHGREILVGAVILMAIAVVGMGTLFLKGMRLGQTFTEVDVLIEEVGRLAQGNDVAFRGVSIGRVKSIEVEPGGDAVRITLELEGEVELDDDVVAIIAPESLFGDWQAEILDRSRYPRFDYYDVTDADPQDSERVIGGFALPDISRLTAAADEISKNLADLTDRFDRAFNEETAENLQTAISNIQQVSQSIRDLVRQQAVTFENVTVQVEQASQEISLAAGAARSMLERADRLLASGEVDAILANIQATTANLERVSLKMDTTTAGLDETLLRVDSAFANIQALTQSIEDGEGSLGLLMSDSTLYLRAQAAIMQLDALLADVRENPRRYINLSIF